MAPPHSFATRDSTPWAPLESGELRVCCSLFLAALPFSLPAAKACCLCLTWETGFRSFEFRVSPTSKCIWQIQMPPQSQLWLNVWPFDQERYQNQGVCGGAMFCWGGGGWFSVERQRNAQFPVKWYVLWTFNLCHLWFNISFVLPRWPALPSVPPFPTQNGLIIPPLRGNF